ncbi:hypothetical protein [Paenibacillus hexagrammi]|uniref:Uncharacterized protein n=1 Tax=Paenibacillus hexagrammi TaxID=2908839 RepID=A0ABY3SF37_9BACL|nr:hypothetical protein [Paenibacillus sp. YPD9-1]UJF32038.1 hypothetical protein L0M14_20175 [Paenibacillus sp. YPD9-1]
MLLNDKGEDYEKKHSKAQIDYLAAREHFLQISKQADKRIEQLKEQGREVGQAEMEEIVERVGLHRAFNELTQAENVLINWSHTAIKTEPAFIENRATFEELFEKVKTNAEARGAILNLAMRLNLELV